MTTAGSEILALFSIYNYWILFFGIMLENAGLPIPGELLLLLAGALTGAGKMAFSAAAASTIAGALIGDSLAYYIGRKGGKKLLELYCGYTISTCSCTDRAENFFARFGILTIPLARFIVGVRLFSAPFAGAVRIAYTRFIVLDAIGAALWANTFLALGLVFKNGILDFLPVFEKFRYGLGVVFLAAVAVFVGFKLFRRLAVGRPDAGKVLRKLRSIAKRHP